MQSEKLKIAIKNLKFPIGASCLVLVAVLVLMAKGIVDRKQGANGWQPTVVELAQVTPEGEREYQEIQIGDKSLRVEVADTNQKIKTGLSYRSEIGSDGMLFVMPDRGVPSFWMKGMRFGLDMVWIDCGERKDAEEGMRNGCVVIDVTEDVLVEEDPDKPVNFYSPKMPVTHVLEVPEGWVEENEVKVGDVVKIGD